METRAPTPGQILIAAGFAISCFGLLLFLWLSFGGPVPLKPEGYRITVPFKEATQLAVESDVRISGVSVGKVKAIGLDEEEGLAEATIEVDEDYAPVSEDTEAILRQKTLLGETYVELTPGSPGEETIPEGGELARAQVSEAVQLDEIFRTFDKETRASFQTWMQDAAVAVRGRGADLNAALGNLEPFSEQANLALQVLDEQRRDVRRLVRDGGEVFEALAEQPGELRGLIENADAVFATTARRDRELQETFSVLPTFLRESRVTLDRLDRFAADTDPLVQQLRPAARELSGTLEQTQRLSPELLGFFEGLRKVAKRSPRGFAALRRLLDDELPPLLTRLPSFLDELTPLIAAVRAYRREIAAFLANTAAATNARINTVQGDLVGYLRTAGPLSPEALAAYPRRLSMNRVNPYVKPGKYTELRRGLESFLTAQCSNGSDARLDPADAGEFPGNLFERIQRFGFAGELDTDGVPAPRCEKQSRYESLGGPPDERTDYLHVNPGR